MRIARRQALVLGAGVGAYIATGSSIILSSALGQTPDETLIDAFPELPNDQAVFAKDPDVASVDLEMEPMGSARPTDAEIDLAQEVLSSSPFSVKPYEVAHYFRDIGRGLFNETFGTDVRSYVRGWPVRYNPVIINFFRATKTNPLALEGDFTSWCAAFVNWCIARAQMTGGQIDFDSSTGLMLPFKEAVLNKGTNSASSGSFRCWPDEVSSSSDPKVGDVVVWAVKGTVNKCKPGKGHVGFFVGTTSDGRFKTLGGNQRDPEVDQHAVVEKAIGKTFKRKDGVVELHSIRSASSAGL